MRLIIKESSHIRNLRASTVYSVGWDGGRGGAVVKTGSSGRTILGRGEDYKMLKMTIPKLVLKLPYANGGHSKPLSMKSIVYDYSAYKPIP